MSDERNDNTAETLGVRSLELGEAFDLLQSPRRRWMLEYLDRVDETAVQLDEVVTHVSDRERQWDGSDGDVDRETVYHDLYHAHVPRLTAAGIASYEPSEDVLELEGIPEKVTEFLDLASEFESFERAE